MTRHFPIVLALAALAPASAQAQGRMAHHHPRGAKIILVGTVVDPICAFARQVADSAQASCARQGADSSRSPVLLADGELYILESSHAPAAPRALLGKRVKVDGTVYPAGSSYLIVVDSMRVAPH